MVRGCETTVTQCIHVPSQLRKAGLPRTGVKNSWLASEGVFTLKHREQVLAATSNKAGISSSLLSVKITAALLFCCFTSYHSKPQVFCITRRSLEAGRADMAF